ncbi:MAG: lipopolysaccharide heptosyltransferase I, partial [Sedimentisphaerales bacterium]|nr:lipopolysaccharide heptosyltransferase I [Sedimentisphaerales bacterium]
APEWNDLGQNENARLIKSNPRRRIYRLEYNQRVFYVKYYYVMNVRDRLKWSLRNSPGQTEFENLTYARQQAVPAAKPLGWGIGYVNGQMAGMLITESLGEVVSLEDVIWRLDPVDPDSLKIKLAATGRLIAQMHRAGIKHSDLHTGNILLQAETPSHKNGREQLQAYITDLQNISIKSPTWIFPRITSGFAGAFRRWRIKNVASLLAGVQPLTDKYRRRGAIDSIKTDPLYEFVKAYLKTLRELERWSSAELPGTIPENSQRVGQSPTLLENPENPRLTARATKRVGQSPTLLENPENPRLTAGATKRVEQSHALPENPENPRLTAGATKRVGQSPTLPIGDIDRAERDYLRRLTATIVKYQRRFYRSRDRRPLRSSRYFQKLKLPDNWSSYVYLQSRYPADFSVASRCRFTAEQWGQALAEPESLLQSGKIIKEGGRNTVILKTLTIGSTSLQVVIKHTRPYSGNTIINRFVAVGRGLWEIMGRSRAVRQWFRANALISRPIPTAWPLAALERREGLRVKNSIFICEWIPDSANLAQVITQRQLTNDYKYRKALAEQLGRLLGMLRYQDFRHRDCKATNIVIQTPPSRTAADERLAGITSDGGGYRCRAFPVDLDGLRPRLFHSRFAGHEALIRLGESVLSYYKHVTLADYARVFRSYIRYLELPETHNRELRRKLWDKISKQVRKKVAKNNRKNLYNTAFKNILIIKPSSLGDIVRTLPILHFLRRRYPKAQIGWLIRTEFADLLTFQPELDKIITFDREHFGKMIWNPEAARDFTCFLRRLHQMKFDLVLDMQGLFRSGFLTFTTGSPVRLGFARARELAWLFYTHKVKTPTQQEHAVTSYQRFATALEPQNKEENIQFNISINQDSQKTARDKLQQAGVNKEKKYVVLLPGGTESAKRWQPNKFAALARQLHQRYDTAIVVLGAGAVEKSLAEEIVLKARQTCDGKIGGVGTENKHHGQVEIIDMVGLTDLNEMLAILNEAALVIGNDSGPLHIAAALGVPLVGLYGPTDPVVVGPYGQMDGVVQAGADQKRRRRYSPAEEHQIDRITVEQVLEIAGKKM